MTEEDYLIEYVDNPEESAWGIIGRGLSSHNKRQAGEAHFQRICFVLRAENGEIAGGALGELYWNWFHLDLLWLKEELGGRGHGHRLLVRIEEEARQRGAEYVFLDTFSFQAPEFYQRHGYQMFGELQDFPPGHTRYFMKKQLRVAP